jgi:NAD(P)-dependent dehydrogenase (short-subunit alcohol dehydrogenase family)
MELKGNNLANKLLAVQVAIVTGASRGIGEYIVHHLARAGAAVVVVARSEEVSDPRLPGTIHSVAESIRNEGGNAIVIPTNMRDPESIASYVERTVSELGSGEIVVNNAVILVPGDIDTVQDRHIDLMCQVDLHGLILMCKASVTPSPRRRRWPHHQLLLQRRPLPEAGPLRQPIDWRTLLRNGEGRSRAVHARTRSTVSGRSHLLKRPLVGIRDPNPRKHLGAERPRTTELGVR